MSAWPLNVRARRNIKAATGVDLDTLPSLTRDQFRNHVGAQHIAPPDRHDDHVGLARVVADVGRGTVADGDAGVGQSAAAVGWVGYPLTGSSATPATRVIRTPTLAQLQLCSQGVVSYWLSGHATRARIEQ